MSSPIAKKKYKFIGLSVSLREDLLEKIDQFIELPYSSRGAAIALLLTIGLREYDHHQG